MGAQFGQTGAGGRTGPDGAAQQVGPAAAVRFREVVLSPHLGNGRGVEPEPVHDRQGEASDQEDEEEDQRIRAATAGWANHGTKAIRQLPSARPPAGRFRRGGRCSTSHAWKVGCQGIDAYCTSANAVKYTGPLAGPAPFPVEGTLTGREVTFTTKGGPARSALRCSAAGFPKLSAGRRRARRPRSPASS